MYRIDEYSLAQNRVARRTQISDVQDIQLENSVYLHPTVIHGDDIKNVDSQNIMYLNKGLIFPMRENPYYSSLLFHTIAQQQEHSLEKGIFLPLSLREMTINLSQYLYQNLHEAETEKNACNKRFLRAFKVFVTSKDFQQRFKLEDQATSRVTLGESYLQVIKLLFEGQTRRNPCLQYLRKVMNPVFSKVHIPNLHKKLNTAYNKELQKIFDLDQSAFTDQPVSREQLLNIILKVDIFNFTSQVDGGSNVMQSEDISNWKMMEMLDTSDIYNRNTMRFGPTYGGDGFDASIKMRISSDSIAERISENFFEPISRYLPTSTLNSVEGIIEPLSNVYSKYQKEHQQQANENRQNRQYQNTRTYTQGTISTAHSTSSALGTVQQRKQQRSLSPGSILANFIEVPLCQKLNQDLVNSNYLLHDIYAPEKTTTPVSISANEESKIRLETIDENQQFYSVEATNLMTNACTNLVKTIMQNLFNTVDQVPYDVRFMLRTLLESSIQTFNMKDGSVFEKNAYLIADLLGGCWLNSAFRWQECFGMPVTLKEEATLSSLFAQSSRLIFEHVLLLKELPIPEKNINGFNVKQINKFILSQKMKVLAYYQKLIGIQTKQIVIEPLKFYKVPDYFRSERSIFEIGLIRLKDLVLLITIVSGPNFQKFSALDVYADNLLKVTSDNEYKQFRDDISNPYFRLQEVRAYLTRDKFNNQMNPKKKRVESLKLLLNQSADKESLDELEREMFRVSEEIKSLQKLYDQKKKCITFGDKVFQEQFIAFQASIQNHLHIKEQIFAEEESKFYDAAIKKFVQGHYHPSNRYATKLKQRMGNMMPSIEEEKDIDSPNSSFVMQEEQREPTMLNTSNHIEETKRPPTPQQRRKDEATQLALEREEKERRAYVEQVKCVVQHLGKALEMPQFTEERINDWKNPDRVQQDMIDLGTLFTAVAEDDKNQPDQCMKLQLDASLIEKNYNKLDPEMKRDFIYLFSEKLNMQKKRIQEKFEQQNYELGLLDQQLNNFSRQVGDRMQYFMKVYDKIKFNRFISKIVNKRGMQKNKILKDEDPRLNVHEDLPTIFKSKPAVFTTIIEEEFEQDFEDFLVKKNETDNVTQSLSPINSKNAQLFATKSEETKSKQKDSMTGRFLTESQRSTQPLPNMRIGRRGKPIDMVEIQLCQMVSNLVTLFTQGLFDRINKQVSTCDIMDIKPEYDYFNIQTCLYMFNQCAQELVMKNNTINNKQQHEEEGITSENKNDFFDNFQLQVEDLILSRIWTAILEEAEASQRDVALQYHFFSHHAWIPAPLESVEAFGFEREDQEELFLPAVETLLRINEFQTPREKVAILDQAVELAMDAYLTTADDFLEPISDVIVQKIITFIIAKSYYKAGAVWEKDRSPEVHQNAFYLHLNMNVIFILMFGERTSDPNNNVILMRTALDKIDHTIKVPLKLEKRMSNNQSDDEND